MSTHNTPIEAHKTSPAGRPPRIRWGGIDYGRRRIGLALADPNGRIVSPAGTLDGAGTPGCDAERTLRWARENEVAAVVVGLPLNMDGTESDQTRVTRAFAEAVARLGLNVELWDERLSSYQADQLLSGIDRAHGRTRPRSRKGDPRRDAIAAQVILQSFLDARRATP